MNALRKNTVINIEANKWAKGSVFARLGSIGISAGFSGVKAGQNCKFRRPFTWSVSHCYFMDLRPPGLGKGLAVWLRAVTGFGAFSLVFIDLAPSLTKLRFASRRRDKTGRKRATAQDFAEPEKEH
jgi:hypothetical protein